MKRLSAVAVAAAALALSQLATMAVAQDTAACSVESVRGTADAIAPGNGARRSLAPSMQVAIEDQIETGDATLVILLCPDDLRISVGPNAVVQLVRIGPEEAGWGVLLPRGIARFARPLFGGARFEVRTPSAVASVRSTIWTIEVVDDATAVFVAEGAVVVAGATQAAILQAGDGVDVAPDGRLGPVVQWGAARIVDFAARLGAPVE